TQRLHSPTRAIKTDRKKSQFPDRIFWERKVYFGTIRFSRSRTPSWASTAARWRSNAAEKEAATRRATDAQVLEDAERLIAAWNERQALRAPMIFSRHSSLSTNGRFNASMRNQPDDDELMNAMFIQLQIKVGVGEAAGAPMLLGDNFTWRRHEFGAE